MANNSELAYNIFFTIIFLFPLDEPTTVAPETTEVPVEPTTVDAGKYCSIQDMISFF